MPPWAGGEAVSGGGGPIASDGDARFVGDGYGHFRDSRRTTCGVIGGGWWVGGARSRALVRHAGTGVRQAQRKRRDAGSGDGLRAGADMPAPKGLGMPHGVPVQNANATNAPHDPQKIFLTPFSRWALDPFCPLHCGHSSHPYNRAVR